MSEALPIMSVSSRLPKTQKVPVHPGTDQVWQERWDEIQDLAARNYDIDLVDEARPKLEALLAATEFVEIPYVCQYHFMLGARAIKDTAKPYVPVKTYGCHPDTWAAAGDEVKARFQVVDEDAFNREYLGKLAV